MDEAPRRLREVVVLRAAEELSGTLLSSVRFQTADID
jgi:hypothetical protein